MDEFDFDEYDDDDADLVSSQTIRTLRASEIIGSRKSESERGAASTGSESSQQDNTVASGANESSLLDSPSTAPTARTSTASLSTLSCKSPLRSILGSRTRHQRLAQKEAASPPSAESPTSDSDNGDESSHPSHSLQQSPSRRVRFSVDTSQGGTQDSTLSSVASSATTSVSSRVSYQQLVAKSLRREWRPDTKSSWMRDMQDDENPENFVAPLSQQANGGRQRKRAKKGPSNNNTSLLFTTQQQGRGGRGEIRAFQETGSWQMLNDDCLFLCDSLRRLQKKKHMVESAAELAFLLSTKSNRRSLLFQDDRILRTGEDSALWALLDLLASFASVNTGSRVQLPMSDASTVASLNQEAPSSAQGDGARNREYSQMQRDPQVLQAIVMVFYFVSLDCTLSEQGVAFSNPQAARRLRLQFLTRPLVMQGLASLVTLDPLLVSLRKFQSGDDDDDKPAAVAAIRGDHDDISVTSSSVASSHGTPDSTKSSSTGSIDPTKAGRWRRKQRRVWSQQSENSLLSAIPESDPVSTPNSKRIAPAAKRDVFSFPSLSPVSRGNTDIDLQSIASNDSQVARTQELLDRAIIRMQESLPSLTPHDRGCENNIALLALTHIITGKAEGSEKSCIDDMEEGHEEDFSASQQQPEDEDDHNPILKTNRLLGESGIIPLLSQALADTLAAVTHEVNQNREDDSFSQCVAFLQDRVVSLISLVDGACLLNESNRESFCEEGYTPEAGGYLIIGLVTVLRTLLDKNKLFKGVWSDIGLETLRALTSLTHENPTASKELETINSSRDPSKADKNMKNSSGLFILARVLENAIQNRDLETVGTKIRYDSIIFCLNCLANCVESGTMVETFANMHLEGRNGGYDPQFLTWLTRWLVEETESFRDAVVESSFGSSPCKHSERRLDKHEDERLVTAGNGFVLLACIMIRSKDDKGLLAGKSSKELILPELPGDNVNSKLAFVKNTLKAFCNFYHYSIGDLSVAVVAPVRKLIAQL